jgi:hypothetical protein
MIKFFDIAGGMRAPDYQEYPSKGFEKIKFHAFFSLMD